MTKVSPIPSLALFALASLGLLLFTSCGKKENGGDPMHSGHGATEKGPPVIAGGTFQKGRETWIKYCKICHEDGGEDDAPILGNQSDWAPRISKGLPTLIQNAFDGIGEMPARGGRKGITDEDLKSAVEYMVEASKS